MVRWDPKNIGEEFKRKVSGTKTPSYSRLKYAILVGSGLFILGVVVVALITPFFNPINKFINQKFFIQESNLSFIISSRECKDVVEDYGENRCLDVLNPDLNGTHYDIGLWITANGDTTVYTERIKFTVVPCYWYTPIKNQQYTINPSQTIEIPLNFRFDRQCSLVDDLKDGRISDFMANFCVEIDYRTNNKFKEQEKCRNLPINTKILLKNFTNQE